MAYDEKNNVYIGYIYLVTNNITGKKYVGQTRRTIQERWADHINRRYSDDYYFHRALIKYGTDNFSIKEIDVICEADLESLVDSLNESEIYYIEYFKTLYPDGYNLTIGGGNTSVNFLKPVNQYDLCGNYIRRYNSIIEASRITGINRKGIANSCNRYISKDGKHIYTSGGFIWRFDGDTDISDAVSNIKYGRKVVKE